MTAKKQTDPIAKQPKIVGLDLSLTGTGWSVYDPETKELTSGVIASKKKGMARLNEIAEEIETRTDKGCEVYIENYGFGSKGQVVYQGELGGIVRYSLWKRGIGFHLVAPSQAKKFITTKGNADKSLMLKELLKRFSIDVDNDNEGDAIALNLIGQAKHQMRKFTKEQLTIAEGIE